MKRILLAGASSNLAEELVLRLAEAGNILALHCGNRKEKLEKYESAGNVRIIERPISCEADCEEIVNTYFSWQRTMDALVVLIGGISNPVAWEKMSEKEYIDNYRLNAVFPAILAARAADKMRETGGKIILVSTASASHGGGSATLGYGMAKAALECYAKRLAKDLAKYNIQVNAVAPGYMETSFLSKSKELSARRDKERKATIPLGRAGTRGEFAGLVEYLLSDQASFITGQVIALDGGDFI